MESVDPHGPAAGRATSRRLITRADARVAFALELMPLPLFSGFYGIALAIGDGTAAGFFAAIGLIGLIASGLGWSYLGDVVTAIKVFTARLIFIVLTALALIDTAFTGLGVALAAVGFFVALTTPAFSAALLALRWWPRTDPSV